MQLCLVHTSVTYKEAPPSHRLSSGFSAPVPLELLVITAGGMKKALLQKVLKAHLHEPYGIYELGISILDPRWGFYEVVAHASSQYRFYSKFYGCNIWKGRMKGWNTSPMKKGCESWGCPARRKGDLTAVFLYLKRAYKKDGHNLFKRASSDRTKGSNRWTQIQTRYNE